ncbi:CocE/NonD family hydrolase [Rhizobium paknamense]|uniref:CocE/NonD family hydrolase n=1 Tax=Rhizobium paknamense TaxID=1206817 RepID=A0ABU0IF21_9HYPH|nr:CocE/NonD family hydrolase [Rhizobium paknamense]MDQ0456841.1 putative CocE/NonD family hydrolase [Rhizobium paknamense]
MLPVAEPEIIRTAMADGTELVADLYRPADGGPYPVLVLRLPYGRAVASTVVLAHPAWYAAQGYLVLVQDVRGRGASGGRFRVLEDDVDDGAETLALAADLKGGNGQVASYGFSYHGMNQFMALSGAIRAGTRRPDAMAVVMAAWNVRDHWAYEGNAFRLQENREWARQMAVEVARRAGDEAVVAALLSGFSQAEASDVHPGLLQQASAYSHYADWLADDAAYWRRVSPDHALEGLVPDLPVLHVGGWHDVMLEGTFAAFSAFSAKSRQQRLMIGPWTHIPWGRHSGALDCGPEAAEGVDREIVGFFDEVLKGRELAQSPVRLYDAGKAGWRDFPTPPAVETVTLFPGSNGRAATTSHDGWLMPEPQQACTDFLVHDPWRPAPAHGLHLGAPYGFADRCMVDDRADVAVYTSPPLAEALVLCGAADLAVNITSDRPGFDLCCMLSMVTPDARAIAITGGYRTLLKEEKSQPFAMTLRPAMMTVPAGYRLRLSLQASAFPAFAVNPGSGRPAHQSPAQQAEVTTLRIMTGAEAASRLTLPILPPSGLIFA